MTHRTKKSSSNWEEILPDCHTLRIGKGAMLIKVQKELDGYTVSCGNRTLKDVFIDLGTAKAAGIFLARKIVDLADADLDAAVKNQNEHGGLNGND